MADLTAGYLLASSVLAALVGARTHGRGGVVVQSLLGAALAVQVQDLVWLRGEGGGETRTATRADLAARATEIAEGNALNPYYRCYATRDGFVAVACLNLAQRQAFLALFGLEDATVEAPDLVPSDTETLEAKRDVTARIEARIADERAAAWLDRLAAAGVPASPVLVRESVHADEQVVAASLVAEVEQPGLGNVRMLRSLSGGGGGLEPAPLLGADTGDVLGELA